MRRRDWMELEQERGISVTSSVMQFDYEGFRINLLDTPGHEDFSEDTYRTLDGGRQRGHAARQSQGRRGSHAAAVRGLQAAAHADLHLRQQVRSRRRGSAQAHQRRRSGSRDRLLSGHVAHLPRLARSSACTTGGASASTCSSAEPITARAWRQSQSSDLDDPALDRAARRGRASPARAGHRAARRGGTRVRSTRRCSRASCRRCSSAARSRTSASSRSSRSSSSSRRAPSPRESTTGIVEPTNPEFTGFVFKIQANMDPRHRDRIAFVRMCSGRFEAGMQVKHVRTGKLVRLPAPQQFLARERSAVEEAWPGDVIGVIDSGTLRIGDTLSPNGDVEFAAFRASRRSTSRASSARIRCVASSSTRGCASSPRKARRRCSSRSRTAGPIRSSARWACCSST